MMTRVEATRIESALAQALGEPRAAEIMSVAIGFEATLASNPMAQSLMAVITFPALTVLYGHALQQCQSVVQDKGDGSLEYEKIRSSATCVLNEMLTIIETLALKRDAERVVAPATPPNRHDYVSTGAGCCGECGESRADHAYSDTLLTATEAAYVKGVVERLRSLDAGEPL